MEIELNYTKRVFLIVSLVACVALVVFLAQVNTGSVVTAPELITSEELFDSAAIRVPLGDNIGSRIQSLSGDILSSLSDDLMQTDQGRTKARHSLILFAADMPGCSVQFTQTETGETGDYLVCMSNQPMWETRIDFDSGLNSDVEDGEDLEDLDGELLKILGARYAILEAKVNNNRVEIKLAGPGGIIRLTDTSDGQFSKGVQINGQKVNAEVNIQGQMIRSDVYSIRSIRYRPNAKAPRGGHVYVPAKQFLGNVMDESAKRINPEFDIGYGGMRQVAGAAPVRATGISSGLFELKGSRKEYNLYAGGARVPLVALRGGTIVFGDSDNDLIFSESTAIDEDDLFLVNPTGSNNPNDRSFYFRFERIDTNQRVIYYKDMSSGSTKEASYNAAGDGTLSIGGASLAFEVTGSSIKVDLNGDGSIGGDTTVWILSPAVYLDLSGGGGSADIDVVFRGRFREEAGDETVTIRVMKDGKNLDAAITNLAMEDVSGHVEQGLSQAGLLFQVDESDRPPRITVGSPGAGASYTTVSSAGERQGVVVITFEKSTLVERSSR